MTRKTIILGLMVTTFSVFVFSLMPLSHADFPSPVQQIRDGVAPEYIQCNEDRVHVVRSNGNHACVTEKTAEKTGWQIVTSNIDVLDSEDKTTETTSIVSSHTSEIDISQEPATVKSHSLCPLCPQMDLSHLPKLGENATVTISVDATEAPLGADQNIILEFISFPRDAVEFPDLDVIQVPAKYEEEGTMRNAYVMPFVMSHNTPANFTTTFKFVQTGEVNFGARIHGYDRVGQHFIVGTDKTEIYNLVFAPIQLASDEEIQELRDLIQKRGGIGPEIITASDAENFLDVIRLEGILTEEEAEYYLRFVVNLSRGYDDDSLSWRQFEQKIIADDEYIASFIHGYNQVTDDPTRGHTSYYRYLGEKDGWNEGYGSKLDNIKRFLASGNYMTQSEIDQYVKKYLSDDFLDTQNFSFDFLPKAYAASTINLSGLIKASQSPTDNTDNDRISGIEVCGEEKTSVIVNLLPPTNFT